MLNWTAAGGQGALFQADIRSGEAVRAMVDDPVAREVGLDVLLCNAGTAASHLVVRCPEDEWVKLDHRYEPEWYLSDDDDGGSEDV